MFNDTSSLINFLHTRRSGKARYMAAPGPDEAQMEAILKAAIRVPDHGKLGPWRFAVVGEDQRDALEAVLLSALEAEKPQAKDANAEGVKLFAQQAPCLVVVLHCPKESPIPLWEQELSTGAACMQLLNAAHALGFHGCWLTGWPTYSDVVRDAFGAAPERIAGFIFIGTLDRALEERPRPDPGSVISHWRG